ncbi:unnamed protein product [Menidia menidia]|uniref:(Atlantic silverside) hypothetical protein n=1 Tax=Menidia menidia TaxID=238744 RepID=A0A8S4BBQ9_9TELE|nr:unnamed protein product [Menidia menidia]
MGETWVSGENGSKRLFVEIPRRLKNPMFHSWFKLLLILCLIALVFCLALSDSYMPLLKRFELGRYYEMLFNTTYKFNPPAYRTYPNHRAVLTKIPKTTQSTTARPKGIQYHQAYPHNYQFIMDHPDVCKEQIPFLVLMVPVRPSDVAAREAIRQTWAKNNTVQGELVITLFLLGSSGENEAEKLREENLQSHDLIQSNFLDTYLNLTIKTMVIMDWLATRCSTAAYAMKVDSDMFLNIDNLVIMLKKPEIPKTNYLTGMLMWNRPVIRSKESKWYVPEEMFPDPYYPTYTLGMGYVFSNDLPAKFVDVSKSIKPFNIEDAYIGMCMKNLGLSPTSPPDPSQFKSYNTKYDRCEYSKIITYILGSSQELVNYWKDLKMPGPYWTESGGRFEDGTGGRTEERFRRFLVRRQPQCGRYQNQFLLLILLALVLLVILEICDRRVLWKALLYKHFFKPTSFNSSSADPQWEEPGPYHVAYPRNYKFIMDDTTTCRTTTPFLVIMVPVAPLDVASRDLIRNTWGQERRVLDQLVETLFIVGLPGDGEQMGELKKENERHHDIIQSSFHDSYRNLTIKTMVMLEWLVQHCAKASFVMKVDSDVVLHVQNLVKLLMDHNTAKENYMTGLIWWHSPVLRNPFDKFYLPRDVFPDSEYPPYPLGMAYIMSLDLPGKILKASPQIKPIFIEDAYLGMCLKKLGVSPTEVPDQSMFQLQPLEGHRVYDNRAVPDEMVLAEDQRRSSVLSSFTFMAEVSGQQMGQSSCCWFLEGSWSP